MVPFHRRRVESSTAVRARRTLQLLQPAHELGVVPTLLLEPSLRLAQQRYWWTIVYIVLVVLIATCALITRRGMTEGMAISPDTVSRAVAADATAADVEAFDEMPVASRASAERLTIWRRVRWVLLSFVPSSMLLAVTTYLSTDVASIPAWR